MSWNIKNELKALVEQEIGTRVYAPGLRIPVAFMYPNTYHLGMSNLGLHILYQILNDKGWACERLFMPPKASLAEYRKTKTALLSLESQRQLADFPYICVTMSFEMDYLNFLEMLSLGHIKLEAAARGEKEPIVIMGGPCATFNPEPLSRFVDAFVIGEGEETLPKLLEVLQQAKEEGRTRAERLRAAASIPGVYVPCLYTAQYDEEGRFTGLTLAPGAPATISRQWVKAIDDYPHTSAIVSPNTEFENMYIVEVARGCGRHCRFCMAGYCFRRPRNRDLTKLLEDIHRRPECTKKVGLMGAAISDYPHIKELTLGLVKEKIPFTVASLRADTLDRELTEALAASGQRTMTVAPEAGSKRMRAAINKGITEEHVYHAMELAAAAGMANIKLYYMIGLPGEEEQDIEDMITMIHQVRARMDALGHKGELVISVNAFVPKPFTPYQWSPLMDVRVLKSRFKMLENAFKKNRKIKLNTESLKETVLQAVLARGDREIGEALLLAQQEGIPLKEALLRLGIRAQDYAMEALEPGSVLPWSHLDMGVTEAYLLKELQKAKEGAFTPMCMDNCRRCGVCH